MTLVLKPLDVAGHVDGLTQWQMWLQIFVGLWWPKLTETFLPNLVSLCHFLYTDLYASLALFLFMCSCLKPGGKRQKRQLRLSGIIQLLWLTNKKFQKLCNFVISRGWGPFTKRASCQSAFCPPTCCNQEPDPPDPTVDTSTGGVFQNTQLNNVNNKNNHETTVQTAIRMSNLRDWNWSVKMLIRVCDERLYSMLKKK